MSHLIKLICLIALNDILGHNSIDYKMLSMLSMLVCDKCLC